MQIIGSFTETDPITQEKTYLAVTVHDEFVGLTLSEEHGPDIDVFFDKDSCKQIISWLQEALSKADERKA